MKQWEYQSVVCFGGASGMQLDNINKYGEDGWEAVGTLAPNYKVDGHEYYATYFLVLLKRERTPAGLDRELVAAAVTSQ